MPGVAEHDIAIAMSPATSPISEAQDGHYPFVPRPKLATRTLTVGALDAVAALAVIALCFVGLNGWDALISGTGMGTAVCLLLATTFSFLERGLYSRAEVATRRPNWRRIAIAWTQSVALGALLAFSVGALRNELPSLPHGIAGTLRGPWLLALLPLGAAVMISARWIYARSKAAGIPLNRTVIIGEPASMHDLLLRIGSARSQGFHVFGIFSHYEDQSYASRYKLLGLPMLGDLATLEKMIRRDEVDTVLVAVPWSDGDCVRQIIRRVSMMPVNVYIYPGMNELDIPIGRPAAAFELPLLMASARPIDGWRAWIKRAEDVILSGSILLAIAPAMLAIAIIIKVTSRGPVFFRQRRVGYNNQVIEVLKFRSMYTHLSDADATVQTRRGDSRVTPVGVWLRRYSLDELPQLLNVLKGNMSLVGPRPHALATTAGGIALEEAVPVYASRHRVKPGITGWAQVNGYRGALDSVEKIVHRVNHDLYYIENWSLTLDLKILWATASRVFVDDNAF
ncbi:MAG: undecaprenyl-phosphate glucose phosphotransferase [Acetobacteraceae bacterium]|nr:undecaprenyl-phosphate glucose phosphotransferase [Pseudomonadota bacterium]